MSRLNDYANRVVLKRGPFLIISVTGERQFAIFLNGRCLETAPTQQDAIAWCDNQKGDPPWEPLSTRI